MDFDEINRILDMVREHELSEFELEREGFKIRIKKGTPVNAPGPFAVPMVQQAAPAAPQAAAAIPPAPLEAVPSPTPPPSDEIDFAIVKSPIVGTFFRSAEPGAAAVRRCRHHGQEGAGALHHRSDEIDERDRLGVRRGNRQGLCRERPARAVRGAVVRHKAQCLKKY